MKITKNAILFSSCVFLLAAGCTLSSKGGKSSSRGTSPTPSTQSNVSITPSQEPIGPQPSSQDTPILTARSSNGIIQILTKEGAVLRFDPQGKTWVRRGTLPEDFYYQNRNDLVFFVIPPGNTADPGLIVASQNKIYGCWAGSSFFWSVSLPHHASAITFWTAGCFSTPGKPEVLFQTADGKVGLVVLPDPSSPTPFLRWPVAFSYRMVSSRDYDGNGRDELLDESMVPWMNTAAYGQWPVFRPNTRGPLPSRVAASALSEDFNRDGRADVVAWFPDYSSANWGQLRLYLSGHPYLDLPFRLPGTVSLQQLAPRPAYFLSADLDRDGFPDLVLVTSLGECHFYLYRTNTMMPAGYWLLPSQTWQRRPLLADYNQDGSPELVLLNASGLEFYKLAPVTGGRTFY